MAKRTRARFAPLPEGATSEPDRAEQEVLATWRAEGTFLEVQRARSGAPPFVFWEGPPTANGRPGIHHVLSRTLKDAVCRFQTMAGKRVERKAGWDTHGLPVELEVEKALGISGKPEIERHGVAAFNQKCRESVFKYREEWERLSERIGYWLDYEHPYVTYEPSYVDSVWYLLARFHRAGLVYRGKRVLPYCGRCGTGLSSHELGQPGVYREVKDPSVIVRFRLQPGRSLLPQDKQEGLPESLLAWTTTPWTLPSNFALAVNPNTVYEAWKLPAPKKTGSNEPFGPPVEVVWIARERRAEVLSSSGYGTSYYPSSEQVTEDDLKRSERNPRWLFAKKGAELVGERYLPLFDKLPPLADPGAWDVDPTAIHQVVAGGFVTVEDGTGIVHQAPYGADDWETARAHRMPLPEAVGHEGKFVCNVGSVESGTFFKKADEPLMKDLEARGLLFRKAREAHSYPHCWRCDTPLFYFPAPAWYIETTTIKQRMLERNARVRWIPPDVGSGRFGEWLENNVDWNISRDRYWGTPLPFWVCSGSGCGAEEAFGSAAELQERYERPLPAGFDHHKPSIDTIEFGCKVKGCRGTMKRTGAVLDCWFDSGAMPYAQYGWPHLPGSREKVADQFPASFICEGVDQTRGWFYTLHAIGAFVTSLGEGLADAPAFGACLVNGLVLDKDGVKMSKRLGNVVDPWELVRQHGADAVRWYLVGSAAPWLSKRLDSEGILEVRRRFFRALLQSYDGFFRVYAEIDGFDPDNARVPPVAERPAIDRWLVSRTQSVVARARACFADHDLFGALRAIEDFTADELSNWYIRRNRRRFWKGETGPDKLSAYASLHGALEAMTLCMAPLAPFTAEMLWRRLRPGAGSVHAARFPESDAALATSELEAQMALVQRLVVMGRALREKAGIKTRQPLRAIHVRSSDAESLRLLSLDFAGEQILDELNVKAWGSLAADDGELCRLSVKPNFRTLGKRLGPRMKAAAAAIARLGGEAAVELRSGRSVQVELEGGALELGPADVEIQVESRAAFDVEADGRFVVWLDTALDQELVDEGLAREVVSRVNALRKARGLAPEERIALELHPRDGVMERVLERHRELLASETLAAELRVSPAPLGPDADPETWDLGEGRALEGALRAS